jgi:uncharacterized protein (DUF305 family)
MKHNSSNHLTVMFFIMVLSGLLSTMNVWADNWNDIRLSLNDVYMIGLMTGWMFFFMGIYYQQIPTLIFGTGLVALNFTAIRTQAFITEKQFLLGMIPHHSMAVLMSKHLQQRPNSVQSLLNNILKSQQSEIQFMKEKLRTL